MRVQGPIEKSAVRVDGAADTPRKKKRRVAPDQVADADGAPAPKRIKSAKLTPQNNKRPPKPKPAQESDKASSMSCSHGQSLLIMKLHQSVSSVQCTTLPDIVTRGCGYASLHGVWNNHPSMRQASVPCICWSGSKLPRLQTSMK